MQYITIRIPVHRIQAKLVKEIKKNNSFLIENTLRDIAVLLKEKDSSPQKIKHHILQLVKLGQIDLIGGQYVINQNLINQKI